MGSVAAVCRRARPHLSARGEPHPTRGQAPTGSAPPPDPQCAPGPRTRWRAGPAAGALAFRDCRRPCRAWRHDRAGRRTEGGMNSRDQTLDAAPSSGLPSYCVIAQKGLVAMRMLGLAMIAGVALLPLPSLKAAQTSSTSCSQSVDPYTLSVSSVEACGDTVFPSTGTTSLPDGGTSTTYTVFGQTVSINTPPTGFDLLHASSAELNLYNIPSVGQDGLDEAAWQQMATNFHPTPAPPDLIAVPGKASGSMTSSNWSGYLTTSGRYTTYSRAAANWTEPYLHRSSCNPNSVVFWDGLGGWGNDYLSQIGTAKNAPGLGQDQF